MIDSRAFHALSCGVYVVGAACEGLQAGCVVNTVTQVTATPAQLSVAVNKENVTMGVIRKAGFFSVAVLDESTPMELIGTFGFHSSSDTDKFAEWKSETDAQGMPCLVEHAVARFCVKVKQELDLGTHVLFVGEVLEAQAVGVQAPMTYAYYHQVKGGKTPPKASSYEPSSKETNKAENFQVKEAKSMSEEKRAEQVGWRCTVCGYIEWVDELPDDFKCPICGVGKEMFERVTRPV